MELTAYEKRWKNGNLLLLDEETAFRKARPSANTTPRYKTAPNYHGLTGRTLMK
jgi:hypothetical protein